MFICLFPGEKGTILNSLSLSDLTFSVIRILDPICGIIFTVLKSLCNLLIKDYIIHDFLTYKVISYNLSEQI